jgi:hypothetical protein
MEATARQFEEEGIAVEVPAISREDAQREDAYWQRNFWQERYYRAEFDYEDYAPAFCVGYVGCVQYGGRFDDAERSLCANWARIKGDSRLSPVEAMAAMRAAWDRMARQRCRARLIVVEGGRMSPRPSHPTLQLGHLVVVPAAAGAAR